MAFFVKFETTLKSGRLRNGSIVDKYCVSGAGQNLGIQGACKMSDIIRSAT